MESRVKRLQAELAPTEAALITDSADRFYLTGFNSSAGAVLVTHTSAYFIIDFRYYEKARKSVRGLDVILQGSLTEQLSGIVADSGVERILVRAEKMTLGELSRYNSALRCDFDFSGRLDAVITALRAVKSDYELDCIRHAQRFTDDTFKYILDRISVGRTEREIMLDMEFHMRRCGSEGVAFDFIVVSGENSSLPHGTPTERQIKAGDFVTMDFGGVYNGYRSDMTRTVAVGNVSLEQKNVYEIVLQAQLSALKAIRAGAVCSDIDAVARRFIAENGFEGAFGHGLGHSVGIEIHENPCFNTRCDTRLSAGNVMTVEPGIYLESKFGVRIEDMVAVTELGCDNLTHSDKQLIVL